jgi:hypothetical protein
MKQLEKKRATKMRSFVVFSLLISGFSISSLRLAAETGEPLGSLHTVKRVYVDKLTGDEAAAQMRDLIITSLHNSKLFTVTEDPEKADATLRGAAEDQVYTDQFQSSDNVDLRTGASKGSRTSSARSNNARSLTMGIGDSESVNVHERKHEAMATVRLVNRQGDVIWSTTQESTGAKFRGASADVADKVTRQLLDDYQRPVKVADAR